MCYVLFSRIIDDTLLMLQLSSSSEKIPISKPFKQYPQKKQDATTNVERRHVESIRIKMNETILIYSEIYITVYNSYMYTNIYVREVYRHIYMHYIHRLECP